MYICHCVKTDFSEILFHQTQTPKANASMEPFVESSGLSPNIDKLRAYHEQRSDHVSLAIGDQQFSAIVHAQRLATMHPIGVYTCAMSRNHG